MVVLAFGGGGGLVPYLLLCSLGWVHSTSCNNDGGFGARNCAGTREGKVSQGLFLRHSLVVALKWHGVAAVTVAAVKQASFVCHRSASRVREFKSSRVRGRGRGRGRRQQPVPRLAHTHASAVGRGGFGRSRAKDADEPEVRLATQERAFASAPFLSVY